MVFSTPVPELPANVGRLFFLCECVYVCVRDWAHMLGADSSYQILGNRLHGVGGLGGPGVPRNFWVCFMDLPGSLPLYSLFWYILGWCRSPWGSGPVLWILPNFFPHLFFNCNFWGGPCVPGCFWLGFLDPLSLLFWTYIVAFRSFFGGSTCPWGLVAFV